MASVNKVIIVGNLGQDPEVRSFPNGGQIANVRIATTEQWKDRQTGEKREHTEWHTVVFNDRLAEIVGQYLRKGSSVYVEGSLRTRKWQDQNGNDRYSTEIRAQTMQMLGGRGGAGGGADGGYGGGYGGDAGGYANPPTARQQNTGGAGGYGNAPAQPRTPAQQPPSTFGGFEDDDIPF